jgi:tripartite-type tricarboxylate transporter receptor subunit TctC
MRFAPAKPLSDGTVAQVFAREGLQGVPSSPSELAAFLAADLAKWAKVINAAGIRRES